MEHTTFLAVVSKHFHKWHGTATKTSRDLLVPIAILLALPLAMAAPQPVPPSAFSALQWRLVGPFRAGRAIAAAGIAGNPYTFFFGAVDGGMWKSTNAGQTWEPISDGQINPSIGAFAIASSNPDIIYVGTGEADIRSDITYGDGVYKSTDGGAHWTHAGLTDSRHIGKLLIDPRNPNLVLVAALGHAYGPNAERGVYRTTDGGQSWMNVLHRGPDVGAVDLAWDEDNPAVAYAAMWEARRTPWSQYPPNQGPGGGLYKSTDEGKTWSELTGKGLPSKPYGRIKLTVVPGSHGNTVYALMEAAKGGTGLYRSEDGGQRWELRSKDPNITSRMWYFTGICVDPQHANIVYVPNRSLMRSMDGGKTFTAIKGSPGGDDYHFLWIDPTNDQRMIVASDQGTTISLDGGQTWSSWYNQPTGQFYHVSTDNQFPYRIYGAQQDAGTACITSRSDFGVITFRDWYAVGAGESGYIAPDPLDSNTIYGGGTYGGIFRFDRITGQSQVISPSLLSSFATPAPMRRYRFTWTSPLVFDRRDPQTLYLGAQVLLHTRDGGLHWRAISPDLSGAQPSRRSQSGPPSLADASPRGWGTIYTVAPSPLRDGLIWAGTDDGLIHVTKDGGGHWEEVTPAGLPRWSKISIIEASPFEAGVAYAAVDRHRLDDFAAYIYRTQDYGQHWSRADSGIGMGSFVRVVRSDLTRPGLLYAGTETGVFVSFDDGGHWQPLQLNLPQVSVRDLAIHDNDLVAATHGRAFWVLDDLTPLQQLNRQVLAADAYLFHPRETVRIRRSVNHDTPMPPEEPHGTNPPSGAIIDYYLGAAQQSPVTLEILDGSGNVLRRFSSTDLPEVLSRPPYFMREWLPAFKQLTAYAGHNRFVWDLRYAPPPTMHDYYSIAAIAGAGTEREPQGPLVLPGKYQVKLSVGNHSYTQEVTIVMDPRSRVTEDALKEQLALALEVWNAISDQHGLSAAVDTLHDQLAALDLQSNLASTERSILQSLETKTASLSDSLADPGLSRLETNIMSADRQPTQQMREAFTVLNSRVSNARTEWEQIVLHDLPDLNRNLARLGLAQIHASAISAPHLGLEAASGNR